MVQHWGDWQTGRYTAFVDNMTPPTTDILSGAGFCLPLSRDWLPVVIGALNVLTIESTWAADQERAVQEIERLRAWIMSAFYPCVIDPQTGEIAPQAAAYECRKIGGGVYPMEAQMEDTEEQMIIKIGGVAYLPNNCGCGDTELYPLGLAVTPTIDPITKAITLPDVETLKPSKTFALPVTDSNLACYGVAATEYLLDRCIEFWETYETLITGGIAGLSGTDLPFEVGAMIANLLDGAGTTIIESLRGSTLEEMITPLNDQTFRDHMAGLWAFSGAVTKDQLWQWANSSPVYWPIPDYGAAGVVFPTEARSLLTRWIQFSVIANYNTDLETLAAQCESGQTLDDINADQSEFASSELYDYNGTTYKVWTISPEVLVVEDQWWDSGLQLTAPICIGGDITAETGSLSTASFQWSLYDSFGPVETLSPGSRATDAAYLHDTPGLDVLNAYLGTPILYTDQIYTPAGPAQAGFRCQSTDTYTLHTIWIVETVA